ncbi:hypothetical protein [Natronolimnobius baerhuensis]|uniref:Permease n=1 Tax=Natronolimnobius baerhuensis TaxID=253108 RepID=A0A202E7L8_9EURY|nr:hypothetical protein [Natronolimnobius baerhuensis]OVE84247.1 hypothetical protein B2G88_07465 [Natronolimnobius baerhuensis]
MTDASSDGVSRLGKSGIGVICGGILLLGGASVLSFPVVSALIVIGGLAVLFSRSGVDATQAGIGLAAVGGIGLLESTTALGFGVGPMVLGVFAIVFGVFDILASVVLRSVRPT